MTIIWPGQIIGALANNGSVSSLLSKQSLLKGIAHLTPLNWMLFENTAFMVWTQSDRGAGATPEDTLLLRFLREKAVSNFSEFYQAMKAIYTGVHITTDGKIEPNKGREALKYFLDETKNRFVGFLSLIPFEIANLSMLSSFVALLPHGVGLLNSAHIGQIEDLATFAVLFGTYLAIKWSVFTKVFDLRGLPMLREWASRSWNKEKVSAGIKQANGRDEVTIGGLMMRDFIRFVRGKRFDCSMNEACVFVDDTEDVASSVGQQYGRRWHGYLRFWGGGQYSARSAVSNAVALPAEMTYRYLNSVVDGYFVMWLSATGAPAFRHMITSLF
jgi:hypothetical protein